jgi:protein SCO1/2
MTRSQAGVGRRCVAGVVAVLLVVVLTSCGNDTPRSLVGYRPTGVQRVDATSLPDAANGDSPFTFRAEPGHLLVTYFGYTSCPDVCPTTMTAVKTALRDLGDDARRVDVAMATVDPARDTDAVLTGYVHSFVDGAHALRTDDDTQLRRASDAFGVTYHVVTDADGQVDVTHTGSLYVVDDQGAVALTWPFGVTATDIAGDLKMLLDQADA